MQALIVNLLINIGIGGSVVLKSPKKKKKWNPTLSNSQPETKFFFLKNYLKPLRKLCVIYGNLSRKTRPEYTFYRIKINRNCLSV